MTAAERRARALIARLPRAETSRRIVGAEVGVHDGRMSREILRLHPHLTLWMVDNWLPGPEQAESYRTSGDPLATRSAADSDLALRQARKATEEWADRRFLMIADSAQAGGIFLHSLDFAFIDADHSYEGVVRDVAAWADAVRPGGLLGGHDYGDPAYEVTEAVDRIVDRAGWTLELDEDKTWWVRLPPALDEEAE